MIRIICLCSVNWDLCVVMWCVRADEMPTRGQAGHTDVGQIVDADYLSVVLDIYLPTTYVMPSLHQKNCILKKGSHFENLGRASFEAEIDKIGIRCRDVRLPQPVISSGIRERGMHLLHWHSQRHKSIFSPKPALALFLKLLYIFFYIIQGAEGPRAMKMILKKPQGWKYLRLSSLVKRASIHHHHKKKGENKIRNVSNNRQSISSSKSNNHRSVLRPCIQGNNISENISLAAGTERKPRTLYCFISSPEIIDSHQNLIFVSFGMTW